MGDYLACGPGGGLPMETIATGINSNSITREDRIRERELFRFYRPKGVLPESSNNTPISSPYNADLYDSPPIGANDVTLGALAQLVAHRLGVHRAMINVIGRETQYTLVESSKTLDLVNQTTSENAGDEAWVGSGGSMHKKMSLCENVLALPIGEDLHPFLLIPDLTKDPRFSSRPYVTGHPHYRFYAGTPLRTAKGVAIGALCAFAHQPKESLSESEKNFMATIADTVMNHLEMKRAAAERDKVTRMSRGLNAFVEGSTSQFSVKVEGRGFQTSTANAVPLGDGQNQINRQDRSASLSTSQAALQDIRPPLDLPAPIIEEQHQPSDPTSQEADQQESQVDSGASEAESAPSGIEEQFQATLSRAAGLLGEALGLRDGGGVVFYDTVTRIEATSELDSRTGSPSGSRDHDDWGNFSDGAITPGGFDGVIDSEEAKTPILSELVTMKPDQQEGDQAYKHFNSRLLARLIKKYPSGKAWEFDEHGFIPLPDGSLSRPAAMSRQNSTEKEARQNAEATLLMKTFTGVRSLIFVPLWDANLSRHYSGCFAWTTDSMARFGADVEFSFLTAFGNSISAEISRLATIDADQRKSDFIGSISHELRSPLHGVLASAEFLAETSLDSFQSTLVSTIDSCGRTLLDTINHVLDFSKINSLRRAWKRSQKGELAKPTRDSKAAMQSSGIMSILGSTDVAAITEEVVDSIYAGKIYAKAFSPADMTDVSGGLARRDSNQPSLQDSAKDSVHVLLDIAPGDYNFVTQPGAIRRIIMNIFGNALKYTDKGSITVSLWQQRAEDWSHPSEGRDKVVLVVKDTGKGISTGYMRTRLYTPFAQENDLAPGTGLGLSIVRNIVTMLRGDIQIRSKVGKGTEVRIVLPNLTRPQANTSSGEQEQARTTLADFKYLRAQRQITVCLYGFFSGMGNMTLMTERILRQYLEEWCNVKCVTDWRFGQRADMIIVDEELLPELETGLSGEAEIDVVVLCKNPAPVQTSASHSSRYSFLLKPFGPYKLARTLRKCIEKSRKRFLPSFATPEKPKALGMRVPDLHIDPAVSSGNTKNARMAVSESTADQHISKKGKTQAADAPRPARPRLSSISTDSKVPTLDTLAQSPSFLPTSSQGAQVSQVATLPAAGPANDRRQGAKANAETAKRLPRILVVDDNRVNRVLLLTFLRKRGLDANEAEDGSLAVTAAKGTDYDIIFMDISMPIMNGFEATREIRKHEESIRKKQLAGSNAGDGGRSTGGRESRRVSVDQPRHDDSLLTAAHLTMPPPPQLAPGSGGLVPHASPGPDAGASASAPASAGAGAGAGAASVTLAPDMIGPAKLATPPVSPEHEEGEAADGKAQSSAAAAAGGGRESIPALIIALTGLASGRDQSEAFTSGVDLYMTKPVSFKEVGRLLDNWMANGGLFASTT